MWWWWSDTWESKRGSGSRSVTKSRCARPALSGFFCMRDSLNDSDAMRAAIQL